MEDFKSINYISKTLYINQFIVLYTKSIICDKYDLFCTKMDKNIIGKINEIQDKGYKNFEVYKNLNGYFANDLSILGDNKLVYLYADVYSDKEQKVVLEVDLPGYSKLWINEKIHTICDKRQVNEQFVVDLIQGKNTFVIEYLLKERSTFPPYIYFQIYSYIDILQSELLPGMKKYFLKEKIKVISQYDKSKHNIKFMVIGHNINKKSIEIIIKESNATTKKLQIQFFSKNIYQVSGLDTSLFEINLFVEMYPYKLNLYSYISKEKASQIINMALDYVKRKDGGVKKEILGRIEKYNNELTFIYNKYILLIELNKIITNNSIHCISSEQRIYYLSEIDETYQELIVYFPMNYNDKLSYPLILCLGISDFDYITSSIENDQYIIVNCSGRGILGGSYVSEACYIEVIEYIKNHYNVDENRIFFTGKSNGGYATWSMIQNYPHLAAAAFPISGYPYEQNILNVTNTPIINYVSNMDSCYFGKEDIIQCGLGKYNNYQQKDIKNMLHHSISNFSLFSILDIFKNRCREKYPDNIYFRTEKNRHLKTFWIQLHGICFGKKYAIVKAKMETSKMILILAKNAKGFTIDIPPQIDKKCFDIYVNGILVSFNNYTRNTIDIRFVHEDILVNSNNELKIDYRKGSGLLDVYMGKLRIVIPKTDNKQIIDTANHFSKPCSNGYYSAISVKYPIYSIERLSDAELRNNLIFINVSPKEIKDKLNFNILSNIHISDDSIEYMGKKYFGDYCVMQIVENPINVKTSILLVQTNNILLYRKNMFTRKIILPFYEAGVHEYWNNEGLVFINNKYYGIYEWGEEMKEL